jgi:hypothetical protein
MKKETIEEAAEKYGKEVADKYKNRIDLTHDEQIYLVGGNIVGFKEGAKWQEQKMYTEEEVKQIIDKTLIEYTDLDLSDVPHWFIQFKKK